MLSQRQRWRHSWWQRCRASQVCLEINSNNKKCLFFFLRCRLLPFCSNCNTCIQTKRLELGYLSLGVSRWLFFLPSLTFLSLPQFLSLLFSLPFLCSSSFFRKIIDFVSDNFSFVYVTNKTKSIWVFFLTECDKS